MKQPCKRDCPDRNPYCRSTCDKWTIYEKERNKEYENRIKRRRANEVTCDGILRVTKARTRRKNYGVIPD